MRKMLLTAAAAAALTACSNDSTTSSAAPLTSDADAAVISTFGAGAWLGGVGADGIGGYGHIGWRLNELPDSLALTADQQASITALVDAFTTAHQADLDSLEAIRSAAEAAHAAGASRDSVHAILESGAAIRDRLHAAEEELVTSIKAVLTDAQKAYLSTRTCGECDSTVAPLTAEQKASIDSLVQAFEDANAGDIAAIKAAREAEREARASGATEDSIRTIRESVRPAMDRLRAARVALQAEIKALLTPEQLASGCYLRRGPGEPGEHRGPHRH